MATRIGINGFGRIGRSFVRAWQRDGYPKDVEIVALNDLTDSKTLAHLLQYDSVHGRFAGKVTTDGTNLLVDGQKKLHVTAERDPGKIPWKDFGVNLVVESTGRFTEGEKAKAHLHDGVKKVLI